MFGKILSISDDLMWTYYELLSDLSIAEIEELKEQVVIGKLHPKIAKESLAMEIVERFHSEEDAVAARDEFERVFTRKELPDEIAEFAIDARAAEIALVDLIVETQLCASKSDARRMIQQNAVEVDGEKVSDIAAKLPARGEPLLKVGKRRFARVRFNRS